MKIIHTIRCKIALYYINEKNNILSGASKLCYPIYLYYKFKQTTLKEHQRYAILKMDIKFPYKYQ